MLSDDGAGGKAEQAVDELRYVSQDALTLVDLVEQSLAILPRRMARTRRWRQRLRAVARAGTTSAPEVCERRLAVHPAAAISTRLLEFAPMARTGVRCTDAEGGGAAPDCIGRIGARRNCPTRTRSASRWRACFVAPAFLYRLGPEPRRAASQGASLRIGELADRPELFSSSSAPDAELRPSAAAGTAPRARGARGADAPDAARSARAAARHGVRMSVDSRPRLRSPRRKSDRLSRPSPRCAER